MTESPKFFSISGLQTAANTSTLITRALEENWSQVQQSDGCMKYIATRPRAERLRGHGLFSDEDGADFTKAVQELEHCPRNVWTNILSLKREDAARLGCDNVRAWMNLLRSNRNGIASAMYIVLETFIGTPPTTTRERAPMST